MVAWTSRTDRPPTKEAITNASRALVGTTPVGEQLQSEPFGPPAQLRPLQRDRPRRRLDRGGAVAVAHPLPTVVAASLTHRAFPAQELTDLSLQRGQQQQLGTQPSDQLHRPSQVTATGEQLIDLDSQTPSR